MSREKENGEAKVPATLPRRGGGLRAIAGAVARVTRPIFGKRGFADGAIVRDWPAVVGPHIAAHTSPDKVVFPAGRRLEGTLQMRVDSGGLALELQHLEPLLVERINAYFGYRAVGRVRLVQGPLPAKPAPPPPTLAALDATEEEDLARTLSGVKEEALRRALEGLGRAVVGRSKGTRKD